MKQSQDGSQISNFNQSSELKSTSNLKNTKFYLDSLEQYKKLCLKVHLNPNNNFTSVLKQDNLYLYLDNYNLKETSIVNKVIGNSIYFKKIVLAPFDQNKSNNLNAVNPRQKSRSSSLIGESKNDEKAEKEKENETKNKEYIIVQGVAKNLFMTDCCAAFLIENFNLRRELVEFLTEGITNNRTLRKLGIYSCSMTQDAFEVITKGLLTHESIESLDLQGNKLTDKAGNMIGRIISRQCQRRDQIVWMYGLRNERPNNNDYARGLMSINLSNNFMSDITAEEISNALANDSYIRSINLSNNKISFDGCKNLVKVLKRNLTLLNMDLNGNPGYDISSNIHKRLVIKLSKNIKYLHTLFLDNFYSKGEYEFLKQFASFDKFNIEIPQHIMNLYNNKTEENFQKFQNSQNLGSSSAIEDGKHIREESKESQEVKKNDLKDKRWNQKVNKLKNKKKIDEIFYDEVLEEDLDDSNEENMGEELLDEKLECSEEELQHYQFNHKIIKILSKIKKQNKNLSLENLQLRKQAISLRAQLLQSPLNKPNSIISNSLQKENTLNNNNNALILSNYSNQNINDDINNPITQNLTQQHVNLSLTGLNNNSANPKVAPMTGEEASYEVYYNRVENLLGELTRLMDNMENIRRNETN